jgi:hypothetical protein
MLYRTVLFVPTQAFVSYASTQLTLIMEYAYPAPLQSLIAKHALLIYPWVNIIVLSVRLLTSSIAPHFANLALASYRTVATVPTKAFASSA